MQVTAENVKQVLKDNWRSFTDDDLIGLTVAKVQFDCDQLLIKWDDGTYSRTIPRCCACDCDDAEIDEAHLTLHNSLYVCQVLGMSSDVIKEARAIEDAKIDERRREDDLKLYNHLKTKLGL